MGKKIPMLGETFGRLTVVAESGKIDGQCTWTCKCECGNVTQPIRGYDLRSGKQTSCGCKKRDGRNSTLYRHGGSGTKLYEVFKTMHRRCEAKTSTWYSYYGKRGISVCPEWTNFAAFREWAYCNGYEEGLTLDRIDNNGNYEPSNCRWVTMKEQSNNRRNSILIEVDGQSLTIAQWSDLIGIPYETIYCRYRRGLTGRDVIKK